MEILFRRGGGTGIQPQHQGIHSIRNLHGSPKWQCKVHHSIHLYPQYKWQLQHFWLDTQIKSWTNLPPHSQWGGKIPCTQHNGKERLQLLPELSGKTECHDRQILSRLSLIKWPNNFNTNLTAPISLNPTNQDDRTYAEAYLLDCADGAEMARREGVTKATHQKRYNIWYCWLGLIQRINNNKKPYLDKLEAQAKICICGAFMHAVQHGDFGRKSVQGNTARKTLDHVAATFMKSHKTRSVIDTRGNAHNYIER